MTLIGLSNILRYVLVIHKGYGLHTEWCFLPLHCSNTAELVSTCKTSDAVRWVFDYYCSSIIPTLWGLQLNHPDLVLITFCLPLWSTHDQLALFIPIFSCFVSMLLSFPSMLLLWIWLCSSLLLGLTSVLQFRYMCVCCIWIIWNVKVCWVDAPECYCYLCSTFGNLLP